MGLSVSKLARASGLSRTTVARLDREDANATPSGTVQLKIARTLESTVQDLFWSEMAEAEPVQAAS